MAAARNYTVHGLWAAVTLILFLSLTFPVSKSGTEAASGQVQRKKVVGSRPPGCVNKCMNCRPCQATLVIPPHHSMGNNYRQYQSYSRREDDTYYLLSWKCKCGDKLFQP